MFLQSQLPLATDPVRAGDKVPGLSGSKINSGNIIYSTLFSFLFLPFHLFSVYGITPKTTRSQLKCVAFSAHNQSNLAETFD